MSEIKQISVEDIFNDAKDGDKKLILGIPFIKIIPVAPALTDSLSYGLTGPPRLWTCLRCFSVAPEMFLDGHAALHDAEMQIDSKRVFKLAGMATQALRAEAERRKKEIDGE